MGFIDALVMLHCFLVAACMSPVSLRLLLALKIGVLDILSNLLRYSWQQFSFLFAVDCEGALDQRVIQQIRYNFCSVTHDWIHTCSG